MKLKHFFLTAALLVVATLSAGAFTFQPMFVRLDPNGPGKVQTFEINNEGDELLAVQLSIFTRTINNDGVEKNEDASNLFTIYPPRLMVEPRSSASVKLQWNGPGTLDTEKSFRLVAESVALDSGWPKTSGIRVMFRYVASVYVGEADYSSRLVCTVKGATNAESKRGFSVQIVNSGTAHVVADSVKLVISGPKGRDLMFEGDQLGFLSGSNYLPDSPRRLFIPMDEAEPGQTYVARLDFESVY